jgi:hypothetical protein
MAGIFSKNNRPLLAGAYVNFEAAASQPLPAAEGSEVAIAATHDWGPVGQVVRVNTEAEYRAIFGPSDDTDLYLAVRQALQGEGFDGIGGAGELVIVRFEGKSAAAKKAKITINKNGGGAAITLTAVYAGSYGNGATGGLSTEVIDGAGANDILIVKLGGKEVERYTFAETNITALSEAINAQSDWVVASGVTSGTKLDQATDGNLAEGTDGTTSTEDWDTAFELLEQQPFAVFAAHGLTDEAVLTSLKTWVEEANEGGKRFFAVVGGARKGEEEAEEFSKATERSGDVAYPEILNVDGELVRDLLNGPAADDGEILLDGSELVARVAGILAARGEYASISFARLANTELVEGRTITDQETAFEEGVITFARDSHSTAPVHIATGLSTWTSTDADNDETKPYRTYRQPKYVRTMHGIETDLTRYATESVLGRRSIDSSTRDAVVAEAKRILSEREQQKVLQPGWTVGIDQNPPPTDEDEFIALAIELQFGRALEQVYFTISVS